MLRKPVEMLDATGLEAVTEFNQWLRGLDSNAVAVWQTASAEAREASAQGTRLAMFFMGASTLLLGLSLSLMAATDVPMPIAFLAGIGAFVSLAGTGSLRDAKQRHDEAARTRLALEHKMGFLHGQLEGDNVSPTGAKQKDADWLLKGRKRVKGFGAGGIYWVMWAFAAMHVAIATTMTWRAF